MQINNPILSGFWADPFILRDGDDYYLYPTKDSAGWMYEKFHVFHSKDLINWDGPYLALDLIDVSWADKQAWAPGIAKYKGKYYMYFSAEAQIGVAVSDSPLGPFKDMLDRPLITRNQYNCQSIDADLFVDDDGQPYLLWGQGKCWIVPLEDDMTTFKSEPVQLSVQIHNAKGSDAIAGDISVYNEGPHMQKRDGRYWLTWSNYDTRDPRYQIAYAFSDHILGPYEVPENNRMTLESVNAVGTGHASLTEYENEWYLIYHRLAEPETSVLRETCIGLVRFKDGQPYVDVNQ
jgi:xylan 1,4-beta-xylosidase